MKIGYVGQKQKQRVQVNHDRPRENTTQPLNLTTFYLSHTHTYTCACAQIHTQPCTHVQNQSPRITPTSHAVTQDRQTLLSAFSHLKTDRDATSSSLHLHITQSPGAATHLPLRCHPPLQSRNYHPYKAKDPFNTQRRSTQ